MPRTLAIWMTVAYMAVLFWLTLGGYYQPRAPMNLVPLKIIFHDLQTRDQQFVVNFLGNLVAFLPVGVLVPSLAGGRRPALRVGVSSFVLSLVIEVLQWRSGLRVADVDDVILNTISGLMGYWLWRGCLKGCRKSPGLQEWRGSVGGVQVATPPSDPGPGRG